MADSSEPAFLFLYRKGAVAPVDYLSTFATAPINFATRPACQQAGLDLSSEQENSMAKKKFIPPDGENRIRRRFHQLLHQKPKVYPDKPRSNKNGLLKPIRRS